MCVQKERMNETTENGPNESSGTTFAVTANEDDSSFTAHEWNGTHERNESEVVTGSRSKMAAAGADVNNGSRKPMKDIVLCDKSVNALIDSGSDINLITI